MDGADVGGRWTEGIPGRGSSTSKALAAGSNPSDAGDLQGGVRERGVVVVDPVSASVTTQPGAP